MHTIYLCIWIELVIVISHICHKDDGIHILKKIDPFLSFGSLADVHHSDDVQLDDGDGDGVMVIQ